MSERSLDASLLAPAFQRRQGSFWRRLFGAIVTGRRRDAELYMANDLQRSTVEHQGEFSARRAQRLSRGQQGR
jgi:hypothetical protein